MFLSFRRNITGNTLLPDSDYAGKRVQSYYILLKRAILPPLFLCVSPFLANFVAVMPCGAAIADASARHAGRQWLIINVFMAKVKTMMAAAAVAALLAACSGNSAVVGVERTRLLVDSRYDGAVDASTAGMMAPYTRVVDSIMGPVVGRTDSELAAYRPESPLSNLLADILVWGAADYGEHPVMGVYNMGGIRASLPKGDVTYGDVLEVAPFENKICFLTLKGSSLMELFGQMAKVGGEGVSHGVELVITPGGQLVSARLNGQPIDPAASYRIATIDYLAEGNDKMEAFRQKSGFNSPRAKQNDTRYIISAYFKEKAARGEAVGARVEGRIKVE